MDDETALTPQPTADNAALAPEMWADLQALAQGARETIQKAWSPHTHRAYAGAWRRFEEWAAAARPRSPAGTADNPPDLPAGPGQAGPGALHNPDRGIRHHRGPPGCRS